MDTYSSEPHSSQPTNVVLHAFDWPYQMIINRAVLIAEAGYKAVLVSPPLKSLKSEGGTKWWQRYQPQDYRVIDNQLGNTHTFKEMVSQLQQMGIYTYVDVVFNHMANESKARTDLTYPSTQITKDYINNPDYFEPLRLFGDLSSALFTSKDFVKAFPIRNWSDPWQVQHGRISNGSADPGLPTLTVNSHVITQQKSYLRALKAMEVKGFRIDAAKHMTLEHIQQVWDEDISSGMHIFGEIITDGGATKDEYEVFLKPYLANTRLGAYDFPLFHALWNVFNHNKSMKSLINPYSLGQALANGRAITFAITHDIPNNDVFQDQILSESDEKLAYSYILGRDGGVPLIYTDLDTSGINNAVGQPRWLNSWKDEDLVNMIRFHNRMHGLPMEVTECSDEHLVFVRGEKGIVILNKGKEAIEVELPSSNYQDLLAYSRIVEQSGKTKIKVMPRSSAMLLHNSLRVVE